MDWWLVREEAWQWRAESRVRCTEQSIKVSEACSVHRYVLKHVSDKHMLGCVLGMHMLGCVLGLLVSRG